MKLVIGIALSVVFSFLLSYVMCAFVAAGFDIQVWEEDTRRGCMWLFAAMGISSSVMCYLAPTKQRQY